MSETTIEGTVGSEVDASGAGEDAVVRFEVLRPGLPRAAVTMRGAWGLEMLPVLIDGAGVSVSGHLLSGPTVAVLVAERVMVVSHGSGGSDAPAAA